MNWWQKNLDFVCHLIGDESKGSFTFELKKLGFLISLEVGASAALQSSTSTTACSLFQIRFQLTQLGFKNRWLLVGLLFIWMNYVKQIFEMASSGDAVSEDHLSIIYNECCRVAALSFMFPEHSDFESTAIYFSTLAHIIQDSRYYMISNLFPSLHEKDSRIRFWKDCSNFFSYFSPNMCRYDIVSPENKTVENSSFARSNALLSLNILSPIYHRCQWFPSCIYFREEIPSFLMATFERLYTGIGIESISEEFTFVKSLEIKGVGLKFRLSKDIFNMLLSFSQYEQSTEQNPLDIIFSLPRSNEFLPTSNDLIQLEEKSDISSNRCTLALIGSSESNWRVWHCDDDLFRFEVPRATFCTSIISPLLSPLHIASPFSCWSPVKRMSCSILLSYLIVIFLTIFILSRKTYFLQQFMLHLWRIFKFHFQFLPLIWQLLKLLFRLLIHLEQRYLPSLKKDILLSLMHSTELSPYLQSKIRNLIYFFQLFGTIYIIAFGRKIHLLLTNKRILLNLRCFRQLYWFIQETN